MASELSALNEEQFGANRFALVSRLADDLAHEIKNPLNAIIINLEVLKVRIGKADGPAALDRVDVIEQEVRRLHHLMDRLLQLLRPERDDGEGIALDAALDELLPLIDAQARLARNRFRVDCSAAVIVIIRRDVFKFAMLNLLTAFHEALGEGGGVLGIRCSADDTVVRLYIDADTTTAAAFQPSGPDYDQAIDTAAALLGPSGGRIDRGAGSVTVTLPRAVGLDPGTDRA